MPRPLPMLQQNPADKNIPFELRMANGLWGQRGYGWRPEYLEALRTQYGAGLREVDFAMATDAAGQINRWINPSHLDLMVACHRRARWA